jgi:isopenicillin-N epimerase
MDQQDPDDYPIWGYAAWNEFRDPMAEFVGRHRDELALLRRATEANSYIANGIDVKPGDEVLMTDHDHPGGEHPWNLKAKRYGRGKILTALWKSLTSTSETTNWPESGRRRPFLGPC